MFSENAKTEILNAPLRSRKTKLAFFGAYARTAGEFVLSNGEKRFIVRCESSAIKERLIQILIESYSLNAGYAEDKKLIIIGGSFTDKLLSDLKIFVSGSYQPAVPADNMSDSSIAAATLRGLFLGAGSVTLSGGYHLEFAFTNGFLAASCVSVLEKLGVTAKTAVRGGKSIVYVKDSESVSDTLAVLGASKAVLELSGVSVERDANRLTNRRLNCDIANIDKTIALSAAHTAAIKALEKTGVLKNLDEKLRETARLRLEHPEASLNDLAAFTGVSKSGIRHRLDKLVELAKGIICNF